MNYVYWDKLLDHRHLSSTRTLIESHDLISLHEEMHALLSTYLVTIPNTNPKIIDDRVLSEDFYTDLGLTVSPDELAIYDKYDHTIAISSKEAQIIERGTAKTTVAFIPMTYEPHHVANCYDGFALFPTGPNPFNIQGYLYFIRRVLPRVRSQLPLFYLQVTGSLDYRMRVEPIENVIWSGFVRDLQPLYETARFMVCPVFGVTGQQVKIMESMAHGVPVIALRAPAEESPMRHGVNGLVADNAGEFAEYVVQLWRDRDLCRRLGKAARDTIAEQYSRTRLVESLSLMV
jgi:glycosyltransferase involved in cell wall biosynthesis